MAAYKWVCIMSDSLAFAQPREFATVFVTMLCPFMIASIVCMNSQLDRTAQYLCFTGHAIARSETRGS